MSFPRQGKTRQTTRQLNHHMRRYPSATVGFHDAPGGGPYDTSYSGPLDSHDSVPLTMGLYTWLLLYQKDVYTFSLLHSVGLYASSLPYFPGVHAFCSSITYQLMGICYYWLLWVCVFLSLRILWPWMHSFTTASFALHAVLLLYSVGLYQVLLLYDCMHVTTIFYKLVWFFTAVSCWCACICSTVSY